MISGEVFRIYHQNESLAVDRFVSGCKKYMQTENEDYREYWKDMINAIENGEYVVMKNEDFLGIRRAI